jgi:hypothetical protein
MTASESPALAPGRRRRLAGACTATGAAQVHGGDSIECCRTRDTRRRTRACRPLCGWLVAMRHDDGGCGIERGRNSVTGACTHAGAPCAAGAWASPAGGSCSAWRRLVLAQAWAQTPGAVAGLAHHPRWGGGTRTPDPVITRVLTKVPLSPDSAAQSQLNRFQDTVRPRLDNVDAPETPPVDLSPCTAVGAAYLAPPARSSDRLDSAPRMTWQWRTPIRGVRSRKDRAQRAAGVGDAAEGRPPSPRRLASTQPEPADGSSGRSPDSWQRRAGSA